MPLISIDGTSTAFDPKAVVSLSVNAEANHLWLSLNDGEKHRVNCRYGMSIWATQKQVLKEINEAIANDH